MTDPHTWWVGGVALAERLPLPLRSTGSPVDLTESWRSDYPSPALFRARLADLGLDEDGLRALLAEEPAALAARIGEPSWVAGVERVLASAPLDPPLPAGGSWSAGFATVLAPFTETATERLLRAVDRSPLDALADLGRVRRCFAEQLGTSLVQLARRTLVLELNVLRVSGRLRGDTPELRFADFVRRLSARAGLRALVTEYPVLARLLAQCCEQAVQAWSELLERFAADRSALLEGLLAGTDPGRLVEVETGAGDRHQHGRSVAILRFEHGARVVFKPRPLAVHVHFNDTVRWFNSRLPGPRLRTLAVLERPDHGWVEYATAEPCADQAQVDGFYQRLGALLALVHALGGTDVHFENLIACADQPVLVDLETLFHPVLARPRGDDPAQVALESSVYRTALLPFLVAGDHGSLDLSALGGDRDTPLPDDITGWSAPGTDEMRLVRTAGVFRGAANRPRLGRLDADPGAHIEALLDGFRAGYDTIAAHRGELTGPGGLLARFAADETRAVLRQSRWYATLLDESTHPDVLRDALERDRLLDALGREPSADPSLRPLVGAELAALWRGDLPLVNCRPGTTELTLGALRVTGLVTESGLARAERYLKAMSRTDRFDQEWVIRAALATRDTGPQHAALPPPGPLAAAVPDPERLLAAACGIADQILAGAHDDGRRVNWLGLEPLDDRLWAILPQGAGLPHGYCGTALFLAQLDRIAGTERYAAVARRALLPVPGLLAALAERPADLGTIGVGFAGLGGIAYALSRLAGLLDDGELAGWAATAVDLVAVAAKGRAPWEPGVLDGDAGCLAAMLAVHRMTGSAQALQVARGRADRLLPRASQEHPGVGLAGGAAGVGWALLRFAAAGGGPRYAAAGVAALRAAAARDAAVAVGTGWCDGPSGTALAVADSAAAATVPDLAGLLERVVSATASRTGGGHSLCHGEAGALDLLLTATAAGLAEPEAALPRAGALLAALDQYGPRCATPGAVGSPGLLTGLAGIGHGLLRLGFGARVPSILLLQPSYQS
ncbi:type 2 lanthipeptide synthetase LanM family protein [Kitasatospora sp. NBC_01287]|uniref:type 2 lanthipeptide synthetase LanM family protein n=1 Tax=Kitasatospora sp. NBC_01287 TaxID=2903573 RepID=UPI00225A5F72|nr:type 2 lanthipeptide synthetase LanM family protein [Kitasatospora sp. NBC_01287]MCX4743977.1 type 2 lanthipeptide synthetase LanM family protein [Kitasatospora sp. NBC_01287]